MKRENYAAGVLLEKNASQEFPDSSVVMKPFTTDWDSNPYAGARTQPKPCLGLEPMWLGLRPSQNPQYLVSGPNEAHCRKNSVRDTVIGKRWIYSDTESSPLHRQRGPSQTARAAWSLAWLVFIGWWVGGLFQPLWGRGRDFQDLGHRPLLGLLPVAWNCHGYDSWNSHGNDMDMSFHLLFQDQGLVLSAVLVPFDSNQCMLCPWATSFFQKLCPVSFPPVTDRTPCSLLRAWVQSLAGELRYYWLCGMAKNKQTNKNQSFKNTSLSWGWGAGQKMRGWEKIEVGEFIPSSPCLSSVLAGVDPSAARVSFKKFSFQVAALQTLFHNPFLPFSFRCSHGH